MNLEMGDDPGLSRWVPGSCEFLKVGILPSGDGRGKRRDSKHGRTQSIVALKTRHVGSLCELGLAPTDSQHEEGDLSPTATKS